MLPRSTAIKLWPGGRGNNGPVRGSRSEGVLGQLLDARYWTIGPPAASASAGAEFEIRYGDAEQPDAPGGRKQRAHEFDACLAQGGLGVSFIEAI